MTDKELYNELLENLSKKIESGGVIGITQVNSLIEKLSGKDSNND